MRETLDRLAGVVRGHQEGRDVRGVRYPESLRRAVARACEQCLDNGDSVSRVAGVLGLTAVTLSRWREEFAEEGGFRPVELVAATAGSSGCGSITLVSPSGYRVEGLTASEAAELLVGLDAGQ